MTTVTGQSKTAATITGINRSADYTLADLADREIQDLDFTFENNTVIVDAVSKTDATITGETK